MSNPMLERKISDAFTGIKIEESLNSKLNLNFEPSREIDLPISREEISFRETSERLSYEIEMGDLNNISESSGIVSGLTSSVNSGSTSGATLPSPREMENHFGEDFGRDRGRLKSAMVSICTFTLLISYLLLTLPVLLWC
jgi:hypothetical protein